MISKFAKNFSVYFLSSIVEQVVGFILLPIFTHYLSPSDYGVLAMIMIYWSIFERLTVFGTAGFISVQYYKGLREKFTSYFTASLILSLIVGIILFLSITIIYYKLSKLEGISYLWWTGLVVSSLFSTYYQIILTYYRVTDKAYWYAALTILFTIINLLVSLYLVVKLSMDWEGRMLGIIGTNIVFGSISIYLFRRDKLINLNNVSKRFKEIIKFGAATLPHTLAGFVINYSDRIFIERMVGLTELGVYNVGYKIATLLFIFTMIFSKAASPYFYENLKIGSAQSLINIVRIKYGFIAILLTAFFSLVLLSPVIIPSLISSQYHGSLIYIPVVSLGFVFHGFYVIFSYYMFYNKDSTLIGIFAVINVVTNIVLNYILIKQYGTIGAAYATVISYVLIFGLVLQYSIRKVKLPWIKALNFK